MGHASAIALGVAAGRPSRKVMCLDGDDTVSDVLIKVFRSGKVSVVPMAGQLVLRARVPDPDPPAATHVSVTIPPGAVAGQTLTVAAPGQPVVKFVVPAGLEAGATVQVPVGTKETA